ncbi:hypothetical protein BDZ97DRAFT_1823051 [Flammula alnicola]|nr:hypothetical protein BDZ97DRAFT_1823051 [Flammula alnicola]
MIQSQVYPTHKPLPAYPPNPRPVSYRYLAIFTVDSTPTPSMPRKKTRIHQ